MTSSGDRVSADARKVLISASPKAGARSGRPAIDRLAELLREDGFDVEVFGDIDQLAERAAAAIGNGSLRTVVAAGGDGTARLVVGRTPPGTPIAVLPLGTENLLAKHLGVTVEPEALCRTIGEGTIVRLDAGRAGDQVFLIMASCGFDAEVVRRLHDTRQGHIHHLSYAKPILDSIRSYQYPELRVYCDIDDNDNNDDNGETDGAWGERIDARWAFVVNLPRYAGGLNIAPGASGTDGMLDVCTFKEGSLLKGLVYLGGVVLGQHPSWDDCVTRRARRVRIASDEKVPYQLDGDPGGFLPLEIEVLPNRLTLIVSQEWANTQATEVTREIS